MVSYGIQSDSAFLVSRCAQGESTDENREEQKEHYSSRKIWISNTVRRGKWTFWDADVSWCCPLSLSRNFYNMSRTFLAVATTTTQLTQKKLYARGVKTSKRQAGELVCSWTGVGTKF